MIFTNGFQVPFSIFSFFGGVGVGWVCGAVVLTTVKMYLGYYFYHAQLYHKDKGLELQPWPSTITLPAQQRQRQVASCIPEHRTIIYRKTICDFVLTHCYTFQTKPVP